MATVPVNECMHGGVNEHVSANENEAERRLHRISTVRQQQGVSYRRAARQMGKEIGAVKAEEQAECDLRLTDLYAWQSVLDVPLTDLLVEPGTPLSQPVLERALLIRIMKTAAAISEDAKTPSIKRLAERMKDQLIEIMPELADVGAWHTVGQRRSLDDLGRVFERRLSDDILL